MRAYRKILPKGSSLICTPYKIPFNRQMLTDNQLIIREGIFEIADQELNLWCFSLYMIHHKIQPDTEDYEKIGTFFNKHMYCFDEPWYETQSRDIESIVGLILCIPRSKLNIDDNQRLLRHFETYYEEKMAVVQIPLNRIEALCYK